MSSTVPQKTAEQLIRMFNVLFNSSMLYGTTHPTTLKSVEPFMEVLKKVLSCAPSVSLVVDRESLFVEEWPVDKVINTKRILQQFSKSGIVSITFEAGTARHDIGELIRYTADSNAVTPVDRIRQNLHQAGCTVIKMNYVRYGKITDDQTVVGLDEAGRLHSPGTAFDAPQIQPEVMHQIKEVLSMAQLFEQPQQSSEAFSRAALKPELTGDAVQSIADLRSSIHSGNAPSVDVLLNAVYQLKIDLSEAITLQKETGKLLAATEPLVNEMDSLTCDVIIKLVKEEYGSGAVPLRRLAEIIRRMLPDTKELKKLLPRLKPALLESGMSLSDYLQLIRTLNIEFESEALAGSLQEAASGIGATVEELVSAIQSQPDDAARLLVMASEIRKGTREDDAQLSAMLTDYIEKVSTSMALDSRAVSEKQGSDVLRQMLGKLESRLLENLKKYGVEEPVLTRISRMLDERRDSVYDNAAARWISSEIESSSDLSIQGLSRKLMNMVSEKEQLSRLQEPLMAALSARGFDREQMEEIVKKIAAGIASAGTFKLPPGVLSANNMHFLLDRELKQHYRYRTPFTIMLLTLEGLSINDQARRPSEEEIRFILPKLFSVAKHILRDIDLVGTLDPPHERIVLSLLTMTEQKGALIAQERILRKIESHILKITEGEAEIITAASVFFPESGKKTDITVFITEAIQNHDSLAKSIAEKYHLVSV